MQVPPCTEDIAANITCKVSEDQFTAWPQLSKISFFVVDRAALVTSKNVTAGRKLRASVAAIAPVGDFLLSEYKV